MSNNRTIGIWMYQNGGGDIVEQKIVSKLKDRGIDTITGLNLRNAISKNGNIICKSDTTGEDVLLNKLDLMFSYNAGEQTQYQMYLYQALNRVIPMINSYESFALTEDKFQTSFLLNQHGIATPEFQLCHRDNSKQLQKIMK